MSRGGRFNDAQAAEVRKVVRELVACLGETRAAVLCVFDVFERYGAPIGETLISIDKMLVLAMEKSDELLAWLTDYRPR